jgi:1-aminocyclopropane-1-carboxylate synthase
MQACQSLTYFHGIAGIIDSALTVLLKDDTFVDKFMSLNLHLLSETFSNQNSFRIFYLFILYLDKLSLLLKKYGIPYISPNAGIFVWIDLRKWTQHADLQVKAKNMHRSSSYVLFQEFLEASVYAAPGDAFFSVQDGYFRLIFSMPWDILETAVERMMRVLNKYKS